MIWKIDVINRKIAIYISKSTQLIFTKLGAKMHHTNTSLFQEFFFQNDDVSKNQQYSIFCNFLARPIFLHMAWLTYKLCSRHFQPQNWVGRSVGRHLKYTNFLLADSCVKVTKKRRVNKLWVFDWPRHAKITSYSEHFEKICLYVQFSANQSFTRNFFVTFLH